MIPLKIIFGELELQFHFTSFTLFFTLHPKSLQLQLHLLHLGEALKKLSAYLFLEKFNTELKKKNHVVKEVCCTNNAVNPTGYLHNVATLKDQFYFFSPRLLTWLSQFLDHKREHNYAEVFLKVVSGSSGSLFQMLPSTVGSCNYI